MLYFATIYREKFGSRLIIGIESQGFRQKIVTSKPHLLVCGTADSESRILIS